ncbi:MAG: PIN domain-containing protein [bacterium]|nr:PIN domain-containing protein [bacterium]
MGRVKYFLDTYAMIEITKANESYEKYLTENLTTCALNLYEFFYSCLKDYGEEKAKELFYVFHSISLTISNEDIFLAAKLKMKYAKNKISYADALGYAMAINRNMRFLTGDKEFKDLEQVEFVK